jgi:Domain of unknown function (DUF4279)
VSISDPLIDVSIYIWGDDLDPADVSARLGITPSLARRKGDKRTTVKHREITAQTGIWCLDTLQSKDLSAQIRELEQKLGENVRQVNAVAGVEGAYVDIYVAVTADNGGGGEYKFRLSQKDLDTLSKIGIPVEFTLDVVRE